MKDIMKDKLNPEELFSWDELHDRLLKDSEDPVWKTTDEREKGLNWQTTAFTDLLCCLERRNLFTGKNCVVYHHPFSKTFSQLYSVPIFIFSRKLFILFCMGLTYLVYRELGVSR